ncbi:hypothetical protein PF003_g20028 [Phytophthora fragariae]|nr:hypothetical protein PF003_g20028 [Phytophthora fragariae]
MNYHPAEKEVLALLLVLKVCYTELVGKTIRVYTRFSTLDWVHKSKTLFGRATQFAVLLSPWHLVVERVKEKVCAFAQLLQTGLTSFAELDESLASVAPPSKGSPSVRLDPHLMCARLPTSYCGHVLSFDGSAKTEKHGDYVSCSWILWKLPEWTIVIAASAYLEATTVDIAGYAGINNGVSAALTTLMTQPNHHREIVAKLRSVKYVHAVREFNAAADSLASKTLETKASAVTTSEARIVELRALNRINEVIYETSVDETTEEKPLVSVLRASMTREEPRRKTFFDFVRTEDRDSGHVAVTTRHQAKMKTKRVRFANEASVMGQNDAARLAESNAVPTEVQNVQEETPPPTDALTAATPDPPGSEDVDPLSVQEERRTRVAAAQDEELRWSNLRAVLRGENASLGYKTVRDAWKMADRFVLSEDGVLYFVGAYRRSEPDEQQGAWMRLVLPSTMVQEVLQSCHDSLEGGHQGINRTYHRVKADYYWI